jgi:hypothetical protein
MEPPATSAHFDMMIFLVDHGANVNAQDYDGMTSLMLLTGMQAAG